MMMDIRFGKARSMECANETISTCRYCHFYQIEGRRGGFCQQLGVPVQSNWKVCAVAVSPFAKAAVAQTEPALLETWSEISALVSPATDPQPLLA
jgi:hypothetical protein